MRSRPITAWYRRGVVAASILLLVLVGGAVYLLLPKEETSAQARLISDSTVPAGVSGAIGTDSSSGGLRLCNKTASRVGIAIGYKENQEWITEGWWNVAAGSCEALMAGPLVSRFYYVYAIDYDHGGEWGGKASMCTRDKMFTIRGIDDCVARGFEKTGFFEVDTGEQKSWTVQLTEPSESGAAADTGSTGK